MSKSNNSPIVVALPVRHNAQNAPSVASADSKQSSSSFKNLFKRSSSSSSSRPSSSQSSSSKVSSLVVVSPSQKPKKPRSGGPMSGVQMNFIA
ncbi:hypothetical protein PIIN_04686 [Serendipita indica DSM 11827]|uniref:Uncharacterized protein n=1 Tax=Serendipita indica (strain DSM 11827) TaxID=1109443 RepID=G4THF3_SERID|nr:hypothetical protein PIIN_04686 [Serendipita indica DSM 11827]